MAHERDDEAFDRYLDGESSISRRYSELGDEHPPAELDARILAEAERAVKVSPLPARGAPGFRIFAWAAVIVMSFSLVLNIVFQGALQEPDSEPEVMATRPPLPQDRPEPDISEAEERRAERALRADRPFANKAAGEAARRDVHEAGRMERDAAFDTMKPPTTLAAQSVVTRKSPDADQLEPAAPAELDERAGRDKAMEIVAEFVAGTDVVAAQGSVATLLGGEPGALDIDALLAGILEAWDQGRTDEALVALAEFRSEHPEHPVSLALSEQGL